MTIDNWYLKLPANYRAVYKIVINENWFYYGSSVNLKSRLSQWRYKFNTGNLHKNRSMLFIFPQVNTVRFEVIEQVPLQTDPKSVEDKYIKLHHENPLCLNISYDSFKSIKNGKLPYGVTLKEKVKSTYIAPKKKIAQFKNGVLIKIHESIRATVRELGIRDTCINGIIKGERGLYKGFDFKQVLEDGAIIDHPAFIPKPQVLFGGKIYNPAKPVNQIDIHGNIVDTHPDFRTAAKRIGVSSRYLYSLISGKWYGRNGKPPGKTAKGYIFKYA